MVSKEKIEDYNNMIYKFIYIPSNIDKWMTDKNKKYIG